MSDSILMVSADRSVVAGERGPFYYMLESFSRHWERIDVIGTRPARVEQTQVFGNVHLHPARGGRLAQAGFIAATGVRLARERRYTVMTSHDYNPFYNGVGAWRIARGSGIPWVSEIHHVPGHPVAATARERLDKVLTKRWVSWAQSRVAGFRVVNAGELPALLESWGVQRSAVHVLPSLYLDLETFSPAGTAQLSAGPRGPAGESQSPGGVDCDLLMVGRLVPNKGIRSVIEALGRLKKRGLGAIRLRIVGRGPLRQTLERLAARHGLTSAVQFVDWVPDAHALADCYRKARVVICASTSEGGPRVAAEAMACGTPVIGTRVGVLTELIRDGRNGMLYDGRVASLTLALQRFLSDSAFEATLRAALPGDLTRYRRESVIAELASGLKALAAAQRS
ncbi:MAG: glycosyltransferase [Planctomycetota bacterium]